MPNRKTVSPALNPTKVRVIRDTRDASKDYFLPKEEAEKLLEEGKLHIDVTNRCYGEG